VVRSDRSARTIGLGLRCHRSAGMLSTPSLDQFHTHHSRAVALSGARFPSADEGSPYQGAWVDADAGALIWATGFWRETVTAGNAQGGKGGGPKG